nr:unnamed protein product [Spirometra erinaceieuropaei]
MVEAEKNLMKGVVKPAIDDSAFDALKREYDDVVRELNNNPELAKFREEYEKIMRALEKSHESEKRLMRKCRELKADIVSNKVKVTQAEQLTSDDPSNMIALKKELEKAWALVSAANEKECKARDRIKGLKEEIATLGKIIETGSGGVVGADTLNELTKAKEKLTKEAADQAAENIKLRKELEATKTQISNLQGEILNAQSKIGELSQDIQARAVDAQRELRKKERMEREMNEVHDEVEAKMEEIKAVNTTIEKLQQELRTREEENRVVKISLEQTNRQLQVTDAKLKDAQQKLDQQIALTESVRSENQLLTADVKQRESEVDAVKAENNKLTKQREAASRRLRSIEDKKGELESKREELRNGIASIEKEMEMMKRAMDIDRKACEELTKERDALSKNLVKMSGQTAKQLTLLRLHEQSKRNLEQEISNYKDEAQKQRKIICHLERERDRYISEASDLTQKVLEHMEEVKLREMQIFDFKKKIAEAETKLKQQQNLYEAVRGDRNLYSKNLIEAQDEIAEMKRKLRIMTHQIAQLKDEISTKDAIIVQENIERQRVEAERDNMNMDLQNIKNTMVENRAYIESQEAEERKLLKIISEAEFERARHKKELDQVISERDILGTQLVRRNDELALLYEKIRIQQSILNQGETQYNQRLEDLRVLKLEIRKSRREKAMLQASIAKVDDLKKEVYRAQKELLREQTRCKALEEELQNPINVHRWRKLEGSDPSTFEMLQKIQALQKRLIAKTEEVVEKEIQIQEKEKLYVELKRILARQPGPEVAEQLSIYQDSLRGKTKTLKAMNAEMNMYDTQIKEYKAEIEKLTAELNDVKRAYFEKKRLEQNKKRKPAKDTLVANTNEKANSRGLSGAELTFKASNANN